jgi:ABC-type nitrate/sulfonate/bicarbonate transport system substrate-binding protein
MVPALAAGQIQGFIVAEPFNALAETRHVGRILRFTGDVLAKPRLLRGHDARKRSQHAPGMEPERDRRAG